MHLYICVRTISCRELHPINHHGILIVNGVSQSLIYVLLGELSLGRSHSMELKQDGSVWVSMVARGWHDNQQGQLYAGGH